MSKEEVYRRLEEANETMKAYYSYPPDKVIKLKKERFNARHMDSAFYIQVFMGECKIISDRNGRFLLQHQQISFVMYRSTASSLVCAFILSPFLGRKIAYDEEFKNNYIPNWFDFTLNKPKNAWTKEELHEQIVQLQKQLHERVIRGEFTPEKLDEMRRNLDRGVPVKEEYAHFAKLHPGVDDDEELED